ncbi:MAG TPA: histidine--tRNA ligase [Candidatus Acidoferrum sp.]|jgi:histidyl-tRNA synthetase
MAEKRKFQAIKGTRDLLPPETELWNRVEQTAREVFGAYGFGEIRLPIFEPTELFARAVGGETDIVGKEMYSFFDNPDISELEMLRDSAREVAPSVSENGPRQFVFYMELFISKVEAKLSAKEISFSSDARGCWNRLQFEFQALQDLPASASAEQQGLQATEVLVALDGLPFGDRVSLRPEATASVCRAYIEHGMHAHPQPVKLHYTGPMFRRERPQKGRYRQFYQIGAEVLEALQPGQGGAKDIFKDAATDAEVIEMVMEFFARLELQGVQLEINSIGCRECRPKYVEVLRAELLKVRDKLGPDSQRRIDTNPLRVLDSKLESEQEIIAKLPRISEHLCADCAKQYEEVKRQLGLRGVAYKENWRLVRGLDYYMRTTFEITAKGLGSQNAVCGGGRYDGLVELLGGLPTKGIGFAIGEDRLILSLQEAGKGDVAKGRDVYIAWMGEKTLATAIHAAKKLRAAGFRVELPPAEQKFGKALSQADRIGSRYALILGEDEAASGQWTLKTLADATQAKFTEAELLEFLRQQRK